MTNLTIGNINVGKCLKEKYAKLARGWITLMQLPIGNAMEVNIESIKTLQSLGYEGVYITLSKDYMELAKLLKKKGVDMGKLAFIDGISQMYGIDQVDSPSVTYVAGPISIDAISEAITQIVPTMKGERKFVFLDSITTVLLYNSLERTLHFSRFLTKSLQTMQVVGVLVSVSKGFANDNLIKELAKLSNEVINLQS
jgi:KaiC/GvpD/RAD55 family RecA-like ATPase